MTEKKEPKACLISTGLNEDKELVLPGVDIKVYLKNLNDK